MAMPSIMDPSDQIDPFLPEFTWEDVHKALRLLTSDPAKQSASWARIESLRSSAHSTVTSLLLEIFALAIITADTDALPSEFLSKRGEVRVT